MLSVHVVIGRWPVSPFGPVAEAMVEVPLGAESSSLKTKHSSATSARSTPLTTWSSDRSERASHDRLRFHGDPFRLDVTLGRHDVLGWALRAVPHRVAMNETWVTFTDMVARGLLRGVRLAGSRQAGPSSTRQPIVIG